MIIDAAMTELLRPTLLARIIILRRCATARATIAHGILSGRAKAAIFRLARDLPELAEGDLLAVFTAGAYGASLGSQYNTRAPAPEILVDGDNFHIVRRRPDYDDMLKLESSPE